MLRQGKVKSEPAVRDGFRLRGTEVSRIEAFCDAVFGFALTLLVVSLNIPKNTDELLANLRGAPVFAVCFVMLYFLWNCHYIYSRRYGLEDASVRGLTGVLLFIVLMFVYPLKFIFHLFINGFLGFDRSSLAAGGHMTHSDIRMSFIVYGIGFAATFWTFALLYRHAYQQRVRLELDPLETFLTKSAIIGFFATGMVGIVSTVMAAVLPGWWMSVAGFLYSTIGLVAWGHGRWEMKHTAPLRAAAQAGS